MLCFLPRHPWHLCTHARYEGPLTVSLAHPLRVLARTIYISGFPVFHLRSLPLVLGIPVFRKHHYYNTLITTLLSERGVRTPEGVTDSKASTKEKLLVRQQCTRLPLSFGIAPTLGRIRPMNRVPLVMSSTPPCVHPASIPSLPWLRPSVPSARRRLPP